MTYRRFDKIEGNFRERNFIEGIKSLNFLGRSFNNKDNLRALMTQLTVLMIRQSHLFNINKSVAFLLI